MIIRHPLLAAVFAMSLLSGCAYRNNYPVTQAFPQVAEDPAAMRVYVDANGTFYPNDWRDKCGAACAKIKRGFSLLTTSLSASDYRAHIVADEKRQMALVADYVAKHRRLYILIHGFNTDEDDARESYDRIRDRIAREPGDGIIEFYWDGLAKLPSKEAFSLAPLAFWKAATGHSQTAGSRGLRRILAVAKDRDIFLISHSRGASVALSALSNPPYSDGFLTKTERLDFDLTDGVDGSPNFLRPPPLPIDTGNRIHLLMLAPAIGCIDFSRADVARRPARIMEAEGCVDVRPLRGEVRFLGYTLNDKDGVLGKFVLPSNWYSATDFGFKPKLGEILGKRWPVMRPFPILAKPHGHDFDCYIADVEFGEMLEAAGIRVNSATKLLPRKPCNKADKAQRKP
jgi:Alpha/beta hydrolase of unknown function (DUF900)